MTVNRKQTAEQPKSFIDHFHATFPEARDLCLREMRLAEESAIADSKLPFRAHNHRGTRATQQAYSYVGRELAAFGWVKDKQNERQHLRLIHPEAHLRLMISRGKKGLGDVFAVNDKGGLTRRLVDDNAAAKRRTLFSNEESHPIINLWLLAHPRDDEVDVYLVMPVTLSENGHYVTCAEMALLGTERLSETVVEEITPTPSVNIDLEERQAVQL